jgi:hypothetical protein
VLAKGGFHACRLTQLLGTEDGVQSVGPGVDIALSARLDEQLTQSGLGEFGGQRLQVKRDRSALVTQPVMDACDFQLKAAIVRVLSCQFKRQFQGGLMLALFEERTNAMLFHG